MPSNFNTFKYAFFGAILLLVTAVTAYQLLYAIPEKKCDDAHEWWSFRYRHCFMPMKIVDLPGMKKSAAAASAAPAASASPSAAGHP